MNQLERIRAEVTRIKELEGMRAEYQRQGRTVNVNRCTDEITECLENVIDIGAEEETVETK